jgi:zinc protease
MVFSLPSPAASNLAPSPAPVPDFPPPVLPLTPSAPALNNPVIHRCASGLTIIAEQMPVEAVSLNIWLKVGSARETDEINGMAHFLEHMIFKGTERLGSGEFERLIEARGAVTNAATSQDYTHYYITTAPKDFADLAPLQVEVVMNAAIPDEGFERERHVVLEEIRRSQDNPQRRSFQATAELTFPSLPYRRQVLGPSQVIEQLRPQQMREFHSHWYRPHNITAVAVGNLPVEQLIGIVEESFRAAGHGDSALSPDLLANPASPPSLEPPFTQITRQDLVDPSLQQARLLMTWRVPGLSQIEQTYPLDILASVLGRGRTSRLVSDLREQRRLVTSISASNLSFLHQGAFYIAARLPAEHLEEVESLIVEQVKRLQTEPVSAAEIAKVRTRVANNFVFGNETPGDRTGLYGYYHAMLGDIHPALHYADAIRAVDAETLLAHAQQLNPQAYGAIAIRPQAD